jgi:hypothetical protein
MSPSLVQSHAAPLWQALPVHWIPIIHSPLQWRDSSMILTILDLLHVRLHDDAGSPRPVPDGFACLAWGGWQICVAVPACVPACASLIEPVGRHLLTRIFLLYREIGLFYVRPRELWG